MGAPVQDQHQSDYKKARAVHSAKLHILTFILSLVLTFVAFYVIAGVIDPEGALTSSAFALPFIVLIGLVQAAFQLIFWMHANEKGHFWPLLGIGLGFFIAITAIVATVYWMW